MKKNVRLLVTMLLAAAAIAALTACSAAPGEHQDGTEEALPTRGDIGGGRGDRGGVDPPPPPVCVWPLANPQYCPTEWTCGRVTNAVKPTKPEFVNAGCAPYSLEMNWEGCHPYNGPMGAIFGTYVLCPSGVTFGQSDQHFCNAYMPAAPPLQRWVITDEAVGPCQSSCPRNNGGTASGTYVGG